LEDFIYRSVIFHNSETAFQWSKTLDPKWRDMIMFSSTPSEAKALGRKAPLRDDWELVKDMVMFDILKHKFVQSANLYMLLDSTGNKYLEETNDWHDTYWGVCNGVGQNKLGRALMEVRDSMRIPTVTIYTPFVVDIGEK
jgi:ribA/ribD-fused uncharacterized protein